MHVRSRPPQAGECGSEQPGDNSARGQVVYERDFHLPARHATSVGGGTVAAFRSKDLELTNYDTSVGGLYLTVAATFPGAGVWGASGRNCATVVLATNS